MKSYKNKNILSFLVQFSMMSISLIIVVVLFADINLKNNIKTNVPVFTSHDTVVVVLDAGHGGEDAGASSSDGLLEKELNLQICENIKSILNTCGIKVVMTRTEDKLLYTEEQNIKGQRKHYDLKNRYLIACDYNDPIFVSVHINKFSEGKYKGLQVYYSDNNKKSEQLAESIQLNIKKHLQADNNRKIKNAKSSIYLLDRLNCPAVLVECGFLSNMEDCENLKNTDYIKQMSFIISNSIIESIE